MGDNISYKNEEFLNELINNEVLSSALVLPKQRL